MTKCKLCLEEKELIKKSHIIPDFMYEGIYDEKHFLHVVNLSTLKKSHKIPSGYYEGGLLCKECETNVISKYESYASQALYKKNQLSAVDNPDVTLSINDGIKQVLIKNLDYTKFKLFLLSILWKSSITNNDFFKEVNLGIHEERIRKLLHTGKAGEFEDYPCFMTVLPDNTPIPHKITMGPILIKEGCHYSYVFLINGIFYWYDISKHERDDFFEKSAIRPENDIQIPLLEGSMAVSFLDSFAKKKLRLKSRM